MSLTDRSAEELLELLQSREVCSVEVAGAFSERILRLNERVGAFLHHDRARALAKAEEIDRRRARGERLGILAGLPVAIKDILCAKGQKTTCGSRMLENFVSPYDAHVVERLEAAGAVVIGRTNLDEFAMGSSTENSAFGPARNPWDFERVPGGSSGGSAAAVAAGMAPLAIGTDTGGSIRQPAAFCGVVGLKPTYGRVSRYGLVAFASSLDQIGPMGRTVGDVALLLEAIAGHDGRDSTSAPEPVPEYRRILSEPIENLRVGVVSDHFGAGLEPAIATAVRAALEVFEKAGARLVEVELPNSRHAVATYYLVATAEASSNLARYDGVHYGYRARQFADMIDMYSASRGEAFGAEVKRRIMLGTFALSAGYRDAYYTRALKVRRLIKADFDRAFEKADVIVGPVTPTAAFKFGEKVDDPLAMYLGDVYTVSANLAGIVGMSVPCGLTAAGLPIGLQILGPAFGEATVLKAGRLYQRHTDWHAHRPAIRAWSVSDGG